MTVGAIVQQLCLGEELELPMTENSTVSMIAGRRSGSCCSTRSAGSAPSTAAAWYSVRSIAWRAVNRIIML